MRRNIIFLLSMIGINGFSQITFNLQETPFSYYGSYMSLSVFKSEKGFSELHIRDLDGRRMWNPNSVFMIESLNKNDSVINSDFTGSPSKIIMKSATGKIEICYQDADILRIKGTGTGMRLTLIAPHDGSSLVFPLKPGQWSIQMGGFPHYIYTTLSGKNKLVKGKRININFINDSIKQLPIETVIDIQPDNTGKFEIAFEQYPYEWEEKEYRSTFEECEKKAQDSYMEWIKKSPSVPQKYQKVALLAGYINWSCMVNPRGLITSPVMLSSKNNMHSIWDWDNCFFSLFNSFSYPDLAWKQFMFYFKYQQETGSLPALVNNDNILYGFGSRQIFAWTIKKMIEANPKINNVEYLKEAYGPISLCTDFWFKYRDFNKNGLPEYHHCNDAWDNATLFDIGMPVESPDICAFLIQQMDILAEIAGKIGKSEDVKQWKSRADVLLDKMIKNLWDGNQFRAKRMDDGKFIAESQSLLLYMPIILGNRLPAEIKNKIIQKIKTDDGMFTKIGLPSENIHSKLYLADSYWRGPVWAPPTLLVVDALYNCGEKELAKVIAGRFCDNCVINGFDENYDPITGIGLKDQSMPWSAAIFTIIAHNYLNE
jgi:putative isomerase